MIWRIIILGIMRMIMTLTVWKIVMMMSAPMPDLILNPLTWTSSCTDWNHQLRIEKGVSLKVYFVIYFHGNHKEVSLCKYFD